MVEGRYGYILFYSHLSSIFLYCIEPPPPMWTTLQWHNSSCNMHEFTQLLVFDLALLSLLPFTQYCILENQMTCRWDSTYYWVFFIAGFTLHLYFDLLLMYLYFFVTYYSVVLVSHLTCSFAVWTVIQLVALHSWWVQGICHYLPLMSFGLIFFLSANYLLMTIITWTWCYHHNVHMYYSWNLFKHLHL